ncbi:MAG: SAM-dependent methyltransferase [Nitrososphaerota archaeon]|nr:SAM-dependent methyltransferase [Nitrososphaerota archaeon]
MRGWDFSSFRDRWVEQSPPWDYEEKVTSKLPTVDSLLDLGTGGGELLSSLAPLPKRTLCTEGYPLNVLVARDRLEPLGIEVVRTYCEDNDTVPQIGSLPFRDGCIDLIIDRHESFVASEVYRALSTSGWFITQQVGSANLRELNELLGADVAPDRWNLEAAVGQLESAGFKIKEKRKAKLFSKFYDIGAVVMFLNAAPGQVPGFSVERYRDSLKEMDNLIRQRGSLDATATRFLIEATKR